MRSPRACAFLASLLLGCVAATAASAQEMYPGDEIIVNPGPGANGILLYPGGKYGRVVRPLLQPGEPYPGMPEKPIHLHMPVHRVARHDEPKPPSEAVAAAPPQQAPLRAELPRAPAPDSATDVAQFDGPGTAFLPPAPPKPASQSTNHLARAQAQAASKPLPQKPATTKPVAAAPAMIATAAAPIPFSLNSEPSAALAAHPAAATTPQTASATHATDRATAGLVRQSQILFGPGVADPVPQSIDAIKGLASPLNAALASGASRVQVVAYGGARGDKSSDARRLSLRRALIIRQLLIDGGVPSERIDVRAMGGATDNDPTDRVDVFTRS